MPQNTQSNQKEAAPNLAGNARSRQGVQGVIRFSVVYFLVALVLMFITVPFILELPHGKLVEALLITVVLLSAVLAVGGSRRNLL